MERLDRRDRRRARVARERQSGCPANRGAVIVRNGKGGRRLEVGMDRWAWSQLESWRETRSQVPVGAFLCVIHGPTAGRRWDPSAARKQLRHAHAIEMAHEGVPLVVIQ